MEVPKDNTFTPSLPPVSSSLYLMAAAQMHADGYFKQPTFEDRAAPVKDAIAEGKLDPQGRNYTTFEKATK